MTPELPEEIAGQIPDGYRVRWKPPRRGVIGSEGTWVISHDTIDWSKPVTSVSMILPSIRAHVTAGSRPAPQRLTKAMARENAVREQAARGDRLEDVARRNRLDMQAVLQITGRDRPRPRFTEETTRIGKRPQRGRTAPGRIRFEPGDEQP